VSFFEQLYESVRPEIVQYPWMAECEMVLVTNEDQLKECIDKCIEAGVYALDLETTGLDNRVFDGETRAKIVGICLSHDEKVGYYLPVRHHKGTNLPWTMAHRELCRLGESDAKAVFHNAKFDCEFLEFNGLGAIGDWNDPKRWHDTLVLAYLRNQKARNKGLKYLSKSELDCEMIELKELFGPEHKGDLDFSLLDSDWEPCVWYAASDAICTLRLFNLLHKQVIGRKIEGVPSMSGIYVIEKMALNATRWMERCRIPIDQDKARELIRIGQKEWWQSVCEVYASAKETLERDVRPAWVKLLAGDIKSGLSFDPEEVSPSYMDRVNEARTHAKRMKMDPDDKLTKTVRSLVADKMEEVRFPLVYDILSGDQLGKLFRELEVPGLQATEKSGQVKTSKDELDRVVEEAGDQFPYMAKIKRFRETSKALSTYLISMIEDCAPDGSLKANFNGLRTDTGRFSAPVSKRPKVDGGCRVPWQGMPSGYDPNRPECLKRLRECIVGRDDRLLVAIDYAGVELRIATNLSREPKWMAEYFRCADCGEAFDKGDGKTTPAAPPPFCPKCGSDKIGDLHSLTTIMLYGEDIKKDKKMFKAKRQIGKATNFLLCYGGGPNALTQQIGLERPEAERVKATFDKSYNYLRDWWGQQHRYGRRFNFVTTAFGRRCPVPDINLPKFDKQTGRRNGSFISKAERNATNAPVQGTSADITKMAMGMIHRHAIKNNWLDRMGMMITMHDELVFDVEPSLMKDFLDVVPKIMASNKMILSRNWSVPLTVDIEVGKDWTVPYNMTEIIHTKEVPEGLRDLLGDHIDDIVNGKPQTESVVTETKKDEPKPLEDFKYEIQSPLTVKLAIKLATAVSKSRTPNGKTLVLSGEHGQIVSRLAFKGKPPRIDVEAFTQLIEAKEKADG